MERPGQGADIEQIVRGLTAASKALRLYPPTSPIPRQAVDLAAGALAGALSVEPVLSFKVARDGLSYDGQTVAPGAPGAAELATALRDHGVAELDFTPGISLDELIAFLTAIGEKPEELRDAGGIGAVLQRAGCEHIRTAAVTLTVMDMNKPEAIEDLDGFLRDLATDPDKVAAWLRVAVKGDLTALSAGLADLAAAAGEGNREALTSSIATAFLQLDNDGRDSLIGLGLETTPTRDLLASVFSRVPPREVAGSLAFGAYGNNMLSMSNALSRLPLAERFGDVMAQVKDILPTLGREAKEMSFLDHMVQVRMSGVAEPALAASQPVYQKVAELAALAPEQIAGARDAVTRSAGRADQAAVATLLRLLDQQEDLALYRRTLDSLAGMVPSLIESGHIEIAAQALHGMVERESRGSQTWPELTEMLRAAVAEATGPRTMKALITAAAADPTKVGAARDIVQRAGDASQAAFVEEALAVKPDGLRIAEAVVGRRLIDMLSAAASRAQWFQVAPLVATLGRESEARPQAAIEMLMHRPDEQTRREVAAGLAAAGGPLAVRHLATLLRDSSTEVAIAAARALGRIDAPGAAATLAERLASMDMDNKDFAVAREVIIALARCTDQAATDALSAIANRRALIKRGHFAEINELARQALAQQQKGGGV
ncbi:MAG: HEAT repeat domain-containing protein [Coriobacteriia bacterium]|nr:HEAT repeat domain-containing protein [Coriobacteriia bacterium]